MQGTLCAFGELGLVLHPTPPLSWWSVPLSLPRSPMTKAEQRSSGWAADLVLPLSLCLLRLITVCWKQEVAFGCFFATRPPRCSLLCPFAPVCSNNNGHLAKQHLVDVCPTQFEVQPPVQSNNANKSQIKTSGLVLKVFIWRSQAVRCKSRQDSNSIEGQSQ